MIKRFATRGWTLNDAKMARLKFWKFALEVLMIVPAPVRRW
jgi:hypothetical protein